MSTVICHMKCKHKSKRALRIYHTTSGEKCYQCTLEAIQIRRPFDFDGEIETVAREENMARCAYYEPIEE
mgnify:CR=1 FL=1